MKKDRSVVAASIRWVLEQSVDLEFHFLEHSGFDFQIQKDY